IYFGRSLQEQLLMKFYKSLRTGGYLIMGKAEIIFSEAREIFKDVDLNARIYQKKNAG
ncbi:protein-glutamate O-methyltransferase CheR, partial [bacterium]